MQTASESASSLFKRERKKAIKTLTGIQQLDIDLPINRNSASGGERVPAHSSHSQEPGLAAGDIVEFNGPPACGKTSFLIESAITLLIPSNIDEIAKEMCKRGDDQDHPSQNSLPEMKTKTKINGCVVLIDCEGKFSVIKLASRLQKRLASIMEGSGIGIGVIDESKLAPIVDACLSRFLIIRCKSTTELLIALQTTLPSLAEERGSAQAPAQTSEVEGECEDSSSLRMVLIEGGPAVFFWQDRRIGPGNASSLRNKVSTAVKSFADTYRLPVLVTVPALFKEKEYLGAAWSRAVTCKIELYFKHDHEDPGAAAYRQSVVCGWRMTKPRNEAQNATTYEYTLREAPIFS